MLVILLVITILYLGIIGSFIYGFDKVNTFQLTDVTPKHCFSVIIPFRDEAENLPALLASMANLEYPMSKFELLFINDASTDESETIISDFFRTHKSQQQFDFKILQNEQLTNAPKKDAIALAVKQAKYDWMVTTDADCKLPQFWLDTLDAFLQNTTANCVALPVSYTNLGSFLSRFQALDLLSLQGATIGGFGVNKPFLCNGANFAYRKSAFISVKGFEGNSSISSGDDIFLLEKFLKHQKESVMYLKSPKAIVTTNPQPNLKTLISQRLRWAAKTTNYKNNFGKLTGLLVFAMNGTLVCLPLLCLATIISLKTLIYIWLIKLAIDFLLLFKTARFFEQETVLPSYIFSSFLYPFFSVYIACLSLFSSYKWKGRSYKK
ncbi:glycosyltransferase [Sediminibacter sp. Hel_I_10]|uniref:glycosyltransferase n=1 Tax=Sediminibacter sp. Hel_I_10 TaxID=1392490 RepID=UPI000478FB18|nr:glycosyltransferase [Sediminibacter sp. Hel_I_10]